METFFEQPGLFDTYIALSPSLWWNHEALVGAAAERLRAHRRLRAALYLSSAGDDVGAEAGRLAAVLRANAPPGLRWEYAPRPDLHHATIYRAEAPQVLRDWLPPVSIR